MKVDARSTIVVWLVDYAGVLLLVYNRGRDGMTPYQRIKGKEWRAPLPAFGESVHYKRKTQHKLEARWEVGVYLGVRVVSTEKLVGTPTGVYTVRDIRRLPSEERYDSAALADKGVALEADARARGGSVRAPRRRGPPAQHARRGQRATGCPRGRHGREGAAALLHHSGGPREVRGHRGMPSVPCVGGGSPKARGDAHSRLQSSYRVCGRE